MHKIHKLLLTIPLAFLVVVSPQVFAGGKAEDIQRQGWLPVAV
jgi:hypothetical protein|tara:strand:- start:142 stop:270 length:129 start_codon:yes stop_codon:yes gene_type:complete